MTIEVPGGGLDDLWDDGEFVLSRVRRDTHRAPALFVRPAAAHPAGATIARLEHAHSLRDDIDGSWAGDQRTCLVSATGSHSASTTQAARSWRACSVCRGMLLP